jgi:hypothetical protein
MTDITIKNIEDKGESVPRTRNLTYSNIGIGLLIFILGIVATLIFQNFSTGEKITFSTASLVSFLFGIALSAASIVLAIAAITLGKVSERIMIERSDESIRLQNDVFVKTTEAFQRIESLTGVTAKRIEDIIAGRAGDISHKLAGKIAEERVGRRDPRELEQEIRESLLSELLQTKESETAEEDKKRMKQQEQAYKEYNKFKSKVLLSLANSKLTQTEKIGDGQFKGKGDDLVDGVFTVGKQRVAICTFSVSPILAKSFQNSFWDFLIQIANEIRKSTFNKIILAFDNSLGENENFTPSLNKLRDIIQKDISDTIIVVDGCDGSAASKIEDIFKEISGNA